MQKSITLAGIDFTNLFVQEKMFSLLTPTTSVGNLNAILYLDSEKNTLNLFIKDTTSCILIDMPVESVTDTGTPLTFFGLRIDYTKFLYAIQQYSIEERDSMTIELSQDNQQSFFSIKNKKDNITLSSYIIEEKEIISAICIFDNKPLPEEMHILTTSSNKESLITLYESFKTALAFIGKDENRNNSASVYNKQIVVNDRRHVYVTKFSKELPFGFNNKYISWHKKNMRIFMETLNTNSEYSIEIQKDGLKMYIVSTGFSGMFINSMANSVPPSLEELEGIKPTTQIFESSVKELSDACDFFSGFYSNTAEFKVLNLSVNTFHTNDITLSLRDSGVAGFGACNIEKVLTSSSFENTLTEDSKALIIYDSLRDFLKREGSTNMVKVYLQEDKPAVYLAGEMTEIFLSKIQG